VTPSTSTQSLCLKIMCSGYVKCSFHINPLLHCNYDAIANSRPTVCSVDATRQTTCQTP